MISKFVSLIYNVDSIKTEVDKAIYVFLKDDLSGYISLIDEKQNKLLEVHDGESTAGIARTSAFKKIIRTTLYGIIYQSLYHASLEYLNFKPEKGQMKDLSIFLRILFLVMSINLSTFGGLPRRKSTMGGIGTSKMVLPTTWRSMFTKAGENDIKEEYKDRYGTDFPEFKEEKEEEDDSMVDEDF